ncbi:MAG: DnaJ domain-containing protein [Phenylobacterium sp.]|uniref:J domain-containing protein n=1 Tax=Phenylobacterium sp. TaxID=1871053 RepID=UPI0025FFD84E|nr:DnaJ domain-containing protein [Phenylobacterium sp.]MBI1199738.1 DnaJ domain-containing protein [Phenylobacterium sp.]
MIYIALGGAALALYLWITGGKPVLKHREWRLLSGGLALAAFTAATFVGVRGSWGSAVVLLVIGLWLAASVRKPAGARPPPRTSSRMSLDEARRILGVEPEATREEVQAAYTRLMRAVHPDKGGTAGLAAQLNAARDRLLRD